MEMLRTARIWPNFSEVFNVQDAVVIPRIGVAPPLPGRRLGVLIFILRCKSGWESIWVVVRKRL